MSSRWFAVIVGVVGLLAARSWLRGQFTEVIKTATTPDQNPIWENSPDWSETAIEFDPNTLVQTYTYPGSSSD